MPGMYSKLTIIFQYNYCILLLTATICSLYEFDEERINRPKKLMYSKEIWYDEVHNACQFSQILFRMM